MASAMTVFFSCTNDFKEIQQLNATTFEPQTEAENIHLKYTDSGAVRAILISPLMLDYSNAKFPFSEFPEGIDLTVFDSDNKENYVTSKYAISHSKNELIELLDSVVITTHDGKKLLTDQLFYDQKREWFYTEKHFTFIDETGNYIQGPGIDFSKDFKIFNTQKNSGEYLNTQNTNL
ncbi:LPS export ABC transporter periplasmic protein LptC [Flavobacterium agricola]|uniref:LPS export ABC transporter periplasmic protein LptC n=1 Tax=Flavobacterium agricola TaxID=2870839 RepID=A0ABY6M257_9FLAO|nr:LPS export ABC transporter periplasmic protein LptC [Flavobacterium agricola]UYW01318.1 LPS export ABC transporter periplasmic protein LptC [Flavobacterium agricola]